MRDRLTASELIRGKRAFGPDRWHVLVTYVLRGEVAASVGERNWSLSSSEGPLLVVNAGERLELTPEPDALLTVVRVDKRGLRRLLNDRDVVFLCDPSLRHQASYADLVRSIETLLRTEAEAGDFAALHQESAELAFVRCLLDGFGNALTAKASRAEAFCSYLDTHFEEPLTIAGVARHFHLSTEHFAKTFKREVGQTFHDYLTGLRLDAAVERVVTSDDTVSRISLDAGFPNTASFNKAFRERFQMTPTAYRTLHQRAAKGHGQVDTTRLLSDLAPEESSTSSDEIVVEANARTWTELPSKPWKDTIGLGAILSLANAEVREQVIWLQRRLGFARYRVGVNFERDAGGRYLHELGSCFDFLIDQGIAPHVMLVRDQGADEKGYLEAFERAMRLFANRYGVDTLGSWQFELRAHSWEQGGSYPEYLRLYESVSNSLASMGLGKSLLGPGLFLDQGADNLRGFLHAARARGLKLPTVSIGCRPGVPASVGGAITMVRTADRHYLRNQILLAREVLATEGFGTSELMVGGWRDSIETSNLMNDSCFEGANILQTVLSTRGLVSSLCYNDALDLLEGGGEERAFLSGAPGLLSRDGIPKPSFYAFEFLSHIGRRIVYASEHVLMSTNDMGNFQLVCHNCARLNAAYLVTPEDRLDYQLVDSYFEGRREARLHVRIGGVRSGTYLIKRRSVDESHGSLGDEAVRMRIWCIDSPGRTEIEHLRAAAQPSLQLERHVVTDGMLEFECVLQSNEIAYLHVIYLY